MVALYFVKSRFKKKNIDKIDLIIDLQSKLRNTIILKDYLMKILLYNFATFFLAQKNRIFSKNHLENLKKILSTNIKSVPFNLNMLSESLNLKQKDYFLIKIILDFRLLKEMFTEKSWSLDNFINLATKISEKNKIRVFLIEKDQSELIKRLNKKF